MTQSTKPRRSRKSTPVSDPIVQQIAEPVAPVVPTVAEPTDALQVTPKLLPIFESKHRHIVLKGGRSSSKSWGVAQLIVLRCMRSWERVLCVRETMSSNDAS